MAGVAPIRPKVPPKFKVEIAPSSSHTIQSYSAACLMHETMTERQTDTHDTSMRAANSQPLLGYMRKPIR